MSLLIAGLPFLSMALACGAVVLVGYLSRPRRLVARDMVRDMANQIGFLFDGNRLITATAEGRALLRSTNQRKTDLDGLITLLEGRFPELGQRLRGVSDTQNLRLLPKDGGAGWIEAEHWGGLTRLVLHNAAGQTGEASALAQLALREETESLRSLTDRTSQLMWRTDESGRILWANAAYLDRIDQIHPDAEQTWPPVALFDLTMNDATAAHPPLRQALRAPQSGSLHWFDITSEPYDSGRLFFADDVSALIRVEDSQRDLMQTLTKTFAGLTIGLAVFDDTRRLILFNPALADLTSINPSDLVQKPRLDSFLDKLRENRVLPEPRNYSAWRRQMSELEVAAENGTHIENWSLFDGRTFRVTGRPFPNGTIAFLIEDISTRITASRHSRAQLDLAQNALDSMTEGVAAFSQRGHLILVNRACRALWPQELADIEATDMTMQDVVNAFEAVSAPGTRWADLAKAIEAGAPDGLPEFPIRLRDGRQLRVACRSQGGATFVTLAQASAMLEQTRHIAPSQPNPIDRASA